jgi:hypothetical protein
MKTVFVNPMIRQSRFGQRWLALSTVFTLLLFLSSLVLADESPPDPPPDPDWCSCPAILESESAEERESLMAQARKEQAACREALGVSMEQQRKGQGKRLDACRCSCLEEDAEPGVRPWGEQRKPARSGG